MLRLKRRACASVLAGVLAGCGSSGGTIAPIPVPHLPSVVTLRANGQPGTSAYRIGLNGPWTPVTAESTQFTVPAGESRYSIAYTCLAGYGYPETQMVVSEAVTDTLTIEEPCLYGGAQPLYVQGTTLVSGTFDASVFGATNAIVGSTANLGDVFPTSGSGTYSNLKTDDGGQRLILGGMDDNGDVLGFQVLTIDTPTRPTETANFPLMTTADAAVVEPITLSGATGADSYASIDYLPFGFYTQGTGESIPVTRHNGTSYSGVPAAYWATTDEYGESSATFDVSGNDEFAALHSSIQTSTAPISVTLPTLAHTAVNHADLSFPLTYTGLSSSDVVRGILQVEYQNVSGLTEIDVATPAWLAGLTSYAPPSFSGAPGFVTATAGNTQATLYAILGFSYRPTFTTPDYLDLIPPPGQSNEAYISYYASGAVPGLARLLRAAKSTAGMRRSTLRRIH